MKKLQSAKKQQKNAHSSKKSGKATTKKANEQKNFKGAKKPNNKHVSKQKPVKKSK